MRRTSIPGASQPDPVADWLSDEELVTLVGSRPVQRDALESGPRRTWYFLFDPRGRRNIGVIIEPAAWSVGSVYQDAEPIEVGDLQAVWTAGVLLVITVGDQVLKVGVELPRAIRKRVAIEIAELALSRLDGRGLGAITIPPSTPRPN
jgi:hypothetical protein